MTRRRRNRKASFDPSQPYGLARSGRVLEAISEYEAVPPNPLVRRRLAELYLVAGREEQLRRLLATTEGDEQYRMLESLRLLASDAPGHLKVGRFRRDRHRENELLEKTKSDLTGARRSSAVVSAAPVARAPRIEVESVSDGTQSSFLGLANHTADSIVIPPRNRLRWEVLPQGPAPLRSASPFQDPVRPLPEKGREQGERLRFLDGLGPSEWFRGSELADAIYYVAVFGDLAIADTVTYGNALYWYRGPDGAWKGVFRRNKRDALTLGARRILHTGDWMGRASAIVRDRGALSTGD